MRRIGELAEQICEELEGAKRYAEEYVEYKIKGDKDWAGRFNGMATDELAHANYLHELAVAEIDKARKVITPPDSMLERWNSAHTKYVQDVAWIKQMLAL